MQHSTQSELLSQPFDVCTGLPAAAARYPKHDSTGSEIDMPGKIKQLLSQDQIVRVFAVGRITDPKLIDLVALTGVFDAIWIDQEHAGVTVREIELLSMACRANGLDSFVRLAPTDYATVMRALEAGAGGILAAQIHTAEETERVVRWAKFWPRGQRGVNASGPDSNYGLVPLDQYAEAANKDTFVGIQIETIDAVDHVKAIASVRDVDLLFVGPSDLAQALGLIGQFDHPRCYDTIDYIAKCCREVGKPWGIVARNPAYARRWVERGARLLVFSADVWAFRAGLESLRELFSEFLERE